jgi:thymidylate kinase
VISFGAALEALSGAGVGYQFRKYLHPSLAGLDDHELDLWIGRRQLRGAEAALRAVGFHRVRSRGHGSHRFYVAFEGGRWLKVDVKVGSPREGLGTARRWMSALASAARAPWDALVRRLPAGVRRPGPVIAVLGPDGAGKGSVIAALEARIPVALTSRYLGGGESGRKRQAKPAAASAASVVTNGHNGNGHGPNGARALPRAGPIRESAFVLRKAVRSWARLIPVYAMAWRGHIVLCDRHPIEVLATRPDRPASAAALERWLAARLTPRPDAIILLDAPAEVLFSRKREHSPALLERWRNAYTEVFAERGAATVSTVGPPEGSVDAAAHVVWEALRDRRRW